MKFGQVAHEEENGLFDLNSGKLTKLLRVYLGRLCDYYLGKTKTIEVNLSRLADGDTR